MTFIRMYAFIFLTPSLNIHIFLVNEMSDGLKFHEQALNLYPNQVDLVKMDVKKPYIMIRECSTFVRRENVVQKGVCINR